MEKCPMWKNSKGMCEHGGRSRIYCEPKSEGDYRSCPAWLHGQDGLIDPRVETRERSRSCYLVRC